MRRLRELAVTGMVAGAMLLGLAAMPAQAAPRAALAPQEAGDLVPVHDHRGHYGRNHRPGPGWHRPPPHRGYYGPPPRAHYYPPPRVYYPPPPPPRYYRPPPRAGFYFGF